MSEGTGAQPGRDCPLCGTRFTGPGSRCSACPIHGVCNIVCCPACGYQFVERSATIDALQRLRCHALRWLGRLRGKATKENHV